MFDVVLSLENRFLFIIKFSLLVSNNFAPYLTFLAHRFSPGPALQLLFAAIIFGLFLTLSFFPSLKKKFSFSIASFLVSNIFVPYPSFFAHSFFSGLTTLQNIF